MKKFKISRGRLELLAVLIIIICGLSVFTLSLKSKTTLTYDNGKITYTGYVVNHRMSGQGKLTYENGDTYTGEIINGVFNGKGIFQAATGWTYTGQFKNGLPDGKGTLKAQNGKIYKGTFKKGIYQK